MFNKNARFRSALVSSIFFDESYFRRVVSLPIKKNVYDFYISNWKAMDLNPFPHFDQEYYISSHQDVRNSKYPPLVHYALYGWREGRSPSPRFNRQAFLGAHPNVDPQKSDPAAVCIMLYGNFDWESSVHVSALADHAPLSIKEANKDELNIIANFDTDFYIKNNRDVFESKVSPFLHYMHYGYKENRDPSPVLDNFYYKSRYLRGQDLVNPLEHYATIGKYLGYDTSPSNQFILRARVDSSIDNTLTVCVHAHCFYVDLIGEIAAGLLNISRLSHAVITVCCHADKIFVENYLISHTSGFSIDVLTVPNRGRDLGPFFVGCSYIWRNYDLVLHIHTKRSPHISWGDMWRQYLYNHLMGSKDLTKSIVDQFQDDPELGILYPQNFYLVREDIPRNPNAAGLLSGAKILEMESVNVESENFSASSMCWCRTKSLDRLIKNINTWDIFDDEADQIDGTFAHVLERLISEVAQYDGYKVRSYKLEAPPKLKALPCPGRDFPDAVVTTAWPRDTPKAAVYKPKNLEPRWKAFNPSALDIHWVIPGFAKGAGGHMTIFRMISHLEKFGHNQTIWIQNAHDSPNPSVAKRRIIDWYIPIGDKVNVLFLPEKLHQLSGDVVIATDCWTAFPVSQTTKFKERFYLVQDMESEFHPAGSNRLIADSTYDLGFSALCAGPWLETKMRSRGLWARAWDLCADQSIYFPLPKTRQSKEIQIALYARPYTPRRAVELAIAGLEVLAERGRKFKVHLFGEDNVAGSFPYPTVQHGILTHQQLAELYRNCDIGVVFSATNYSLIPLEMAACRLPVVELDVESTRAVFSNNEVTFAKPTPIGVADAIQRLMDDSSLRDQQAESAHTYVSKRNWENSARDIEAALIDRLTELNYRPISPLELAMPPVLEKSKVSIFIPTYNAGQAFRRILEVATAQKCDFKYDILIIDSGSTDSTCEIAKSFGSKNVRLEHIPNREFQHGRTRNLGISMTDGDYVAILTQDAQPKDDSWLSCLVSGFGSGDRVAGVTGRHEAYPEHGPFIARDMQGHFDALALLPDVIDNSLGLPSNYYPGSITWRMMAYFYSDNNSAMARSVWKEIPYPEIEWGEDYVWCSAIIKAGFQKAYVNDAVVFHSHDFDPDKQFKTAMDEGLFWMKEFGIQLHDHADPVINMMKANDTAYAIANGIPRPLLSRRLKANEAVVRGRIAGAQKSGE